MAQFIAMILEGLGKILAPLFSYQLGAEKKEKEYGAKEIENIAKASNARNLLNTDADYGERLRRKYTRR